MEVVQAWDMIDDLKGESINELIDLVDNMVMDKVKSDIICEAITTNAVEKDYGNDATIKPGGNIINVLCSSQCSTEKDDDDSGSISDGDDLSNTVPKCAGMSPNQTCQLNSPSNSDIKTTKKVKLVLFHFFSAQP
jgi:hypothetical protein